MNYKQSIALELHRALVRTLPVTIPYYLYREKCILSTVHNGFLVFRNVQPAKSCAVMMMVTESVGSRFPAAVTHFEEYVVFAIH